MGLSNRKWPQKELINQLGGNACGSNGTKARIKYCASIGLHWWPYYCSSFWWNFCGRACFRVVFSFFWRTLLCFLLSPHMFDGIRFKFSQVILFFLLVRHSDSFQIWLFSAMHFLVLLFIIRIFQCHIPFLFSGCFSFCSYPTLQFFLFFF